MHNDNNRNNITERTATPTKPGRLIRRLTATGIVLGVSAGAVGAFAAVPAEQSTGHTTFVPITPCRLIDTRPQNDLGDRQTPLGPGETYVQQVTGVHGNCEIPQDATAVALNATAVTPTAASHATFFPADAPLPTTSNLNWVAGAPPTPNKVDVQLSDNGAVAIHNAFGSVDLVVDVTGFYSDELLNDLSVLAKTGAQKPTTLVAGDQSDGLDPLPNIPTTIASVTIAAEQSGAVALQSAASLTSDTEGAMARCGVYADGESLTADVIQGWEAGGASPYFGQVSTTRIVEIAGGEPATFHLWCFRTGPHAVELLNAHLTAVFVEQDPTGAKAM